MNTTEIQSDVRREMVVTTEYIDELLDEMEEVLAFEKYSDSDLQRLCHAGRRLVRCAWFGESYFWIQQRIDRGARLLEQAADVNQGSPYATNCKARPIAFQRAIERVQQETLKWKKFQDSPSGRSL